MNTYAYEVIYRNEFNDIALEDVFSYLFEEINKDMVSKEIILYEKSYKKTTV